MIICKIFITKLTKQITLFSDIILIVYWNVLSNSCTVLLIEKIDRFYRWM